MMISNLDELKIYQIAVKLRDEIYEEVGRIPHYWTIDDVRQIKRSSSSAAANIAEGFGRRFYPKDFIWFLNIVIGSSDETGNHVMTLYKAGYLRYERALYFKKSYKDLAIRTVNLRNHSIKIQNQKKHNN